MRLVVVQNFFGRTEDGSGCTYKHRTVWPGWTWRGADRNRAEQMNDDNNKEKSDLRNFELCPAVARFHYKKNWKTSLWRLLRCAVLFGRTTAGNSAQKGMISCLARRELLHECERRAKMQCGMELSTWKMRFCGQN